MNASNRDMGHEHAGQLRAAGAVVCFEATGVSGMAALGQALIAAD